ncbi:hypothetical protein JCM8115_005549 [Rhodotorula mucilaginosa]
MAHPAVGGKGLPPVVSAPVYIPSSPAASSVVSGYAPPSHLASSYHATTAGPPPDLTTRIQLKLRYLRLQSKYNRSIEARKDLEIELAEKEATQQRLQDEVDLIIDQIYDSDYAHLLPKRDSLFSDDDEEEEEDGSADEEPAQVKAEEDGGAASEGKDRKGKRKMEERDLDELEAERRTQLEARYGIDGTRRNVSRVPTPPPAPTPAPPQQAPAAAASLIPPSQPPTAAAPPYPTQPASGGPIPPSAAEAPAPPAAPKRLKFKFGGGGGA